VQVFQVLSTALWAMIYSSMAYHLLVHPPRSNMLTRDTLWMQEVSARTGVAWSEASIRSLLETTRSDVSPIEIGALSQGVAALDALSQGVAALDALSQGVAALDALSQGVAALDG